MSDGPEKPRTRRKTRSSNWKKIKRKLKHQRHRLPALLFLCLVGGAICYVAIKPKAPKTAGTWKARLTGGPSGDNKPGTSELRAVDSGASDSARSLDSKAAETLTDNSESGSASELLDELIRLESKQQTQSLTIRFLDSQRRMKIASRVLELNPSEKDEIYAISSLIGASFEADSTNIRGKIYEDQVREELTRIRDKYCDHPNALIGAKASVGFPIVHLHNYFETQDNSELVATADQFDLHCDKICRHPSMATFFTQYIVTQYRSSEHSNEYKKLTSRVMKRMVKSDDQKIKDIAKSLGEYILFSQSNLGSLAERIKSENAIAGDDVQNLFEGLEANPSSTLSVYKVATRVIVEYHILGDTEKAEALLKRLVSINKKNESKEIRETVAKGIVEFEKFKQKFDTSAPAPK